MPFILLHEATVRKQLRKRGVKTLTGLGRYFQTLDTTGDGRIDKHEFKEALKKINIQIPPEVCNVGRKEFFHSLFVEQYDKQCVVRTFFAMLNEI